MKTKGRHSNSSYSHYASSSFENTYSQEDALLSGSKQSTRKRPQFPGAVPVNSTDIQTLLHQTKQENPANAVLGKPSTCQCRHGFPQAFSLDPVPFSQNRLISGLLKLTCPLLVQRIDTLEDDGFMEQINLKLEEEALTTQHEKRSGSLLADFINHSHKIHSSSRKALLLSSTDSFGSTDLSPYQIVEQKLGKRGAQYFMDAGVAGANPSTGKPDVKCLHAWMADYLFRTPTDEVIACSERDVSKSGVTNDHPMGELIKDALLNRGVDITGTDNCYQICSGLTSISTSQNGSVSVPTPRNKQLKRRIRATERRRRLHKVRQSEL
eukprot:CCRYP_002008-RA/>CCRYP_002008-RA protein AED:0.02 eAED:0.02 QI:531/1/1/1/0/0/2/690/323